MLLVELGNRGFVGNGGLVKIFLFLKRGPFLFSDFKNLKNRFLLRLVVVHSLGSVISAP